HGLDVGDPTVRCESLPVGTQARVEILRALAGRPRVLLLDEPTAVLTPPEIDELFATLRPLRDAGLLMLFGTHKLNEALTRCDSVSVLRRGRLVAHTAARDVTAEQLAHLMVGDAARSATSRPRVPPAVRSTEPFALVARDVATEPA